MNYSEVRELMESGDVFATSHYDWESREDLEIQIVRFFTQSEFAHVGIVVVDDGRVWLLEAVMPEVRKIPLSELKGKFYWIPMKKPLSLEATKFALSLEGMEYSKLEAMRGYFDINDESDDKTQCAEVVRIVRNKDGIILNGRATPTSVVYDCMELSNPLIMVNDERI